MSGGSWNYLFVQVREAAEELQADTTDPLRQRFGQHLALCAKALHDIEWVDSGDYGRQGDAESIRAALADSAPIDGPVREGLRALGQRLIKLADGGDE